MSRLVFTLFIFFYFSSDILACRIWAVISKSDLSLNMVNQQDFDFVSSQLDALFDQSQYNQNGWAVIRYGMGQDSIDDTVFRSELPANQDSLNYWSTMNGIFNQQSENIAIAHIRAATSGASSIPNPHPWIFESGQTYSFVHNGGASKELLYDLITNNGLDESWLEQHPPQTFGDGDWRDNGWSSVVDSELIMLLIMKQIDIFDDVLTGLESAIYLMIEAGISPYMLNLVFSDSESLFIYGGNSGLKFIESESFYSVMSSPPVNSSSDSWESIAYGELVVLKKDGITRHQAFGVMQNNEPEITVPQYPELYSAYPNPFNGQVVIPFKIPNKNKTLISIFNIAGNNVYNKYLSTKEKETGKIIWRPEGNAGYMLPSGVYVIKMISDEITNTSKIMFIK